MDARLAHAALAAAALLSVGAGHRTLNFVVTAPTSSLAREIGQAAERYRRDLAIEWLGRELSPWSAPCPITTHVVPRGAGGVTSFMFDRGGQPFGWQMTVQGPKERIFDSVLPHEITHTIFATHFGRPLPRWADEGACTTMEHESEKGKQKRMLVTFLKTKRGIPFNRMFAMKEYPPDMLPLYAQGYALARFLIAQGGRRKFVMYVGDGMKWNNWTAATKQHYGYKSLSELQVTWLDWIRKGSPPIDSETGRPSGKTLVAVGDRTPAATYGTRPTNRPANRTAAIAVSQRNGRAGTSWYVQQRGRARDRHEQPGEVAQTAGHNPLPRQGSQRTLTRHQPVEQSRQIIFQQSRPHHAVPTPAAPIGAAPRSDRPLLSRPVHRSTVGPRGTTVWH